VLASSNLKTNDFWAARAHRENAQIVRLAVDWDGVAPIIPANTFNASDPDDPGYRWNQVDQQVQQLSEEHFKILITVTTAPTWAEGPDRPSSALPGTWKPNPRDFGEFARAIAERYDGSYPDPNAPGRVLPKVMYWQGWNEPNLPQYLSPQWSHPSTYSYSALSPSIYRALANAFYAGVKSVSRKNYVLLAGLAPFGDAPSQMARMRPVQFERDLFCVNGSLERTSSCPGPTYLDAIDSHPYGTIYGPDYHAYVADDVSIQDVHKLVRVLRAAKKFGTVMPAGSKGNWVTETSWDTDPPDPEGVPAQKEALWVEQEFYNLWAQGVSTVLWWQLADSPPIPNYASTYQAGTYFLDGGPKPAATAFRFPFVARRTSPETVIVWSRAPTAGVVSVQEKVANGWRTLTRVRVSTFQVFEARLNLHLRETLRGKIGTEASLPWTQPS
jgi:hypothetical protein